MDKLLLHKQSRLSLEAFAARPRHALLVEGERGIGTYTIAAQLACALTGNTAATLTLAPTGGTIPIDDVRQLYSLTRAARDQALVVIIDDADAMGHDAQNSLLKLLEEPPTHVYFILTSHAAHRLLATIVSRVERITLRPVSVKESQDFLAVHGVNDATTRAKLLFLAGGRPAELSRLMSDEAYFATAAERMSDARRFLSEDAYGRLVLVKPYLAKRDECEAFLVMVGQLLTHSMRREVSETSVKALEAVNRALDAIAANGSLRAQILGVSDRISVV